ncbi:MAG: hypothetical protein QNJ46_08520 [Leptolyngbyaceae cyanobacterium MO_188.B28]|nr:hypothetical protein [Leptolyngbyaceae cyanobacterium MO_188.B28]
MVEPFFDGVGNQFARTEIAAEFVGNTWEFTRERVYSLKGMISPWRMFSLVTKDTALSSEIQRN